MGDDRRNVKCVGCGCLVFASAADARCMACKGGVPKNVFAEWRDHADDESSGADAGRGESWCKGETDERIGSIPRNPWADSTRAAREISQKGALDPNTIADFAKKL